MPKLNSFSLYLAKPDVKGFDELLTENARCPIGHQLLEVSVHGIRPLHQVAATIDLTPVSSVFLMFELRHERNVWKSHFAMQVFLLKFPAKPARRKTASSMLFPWLFIPLQSRLNFT
jgi:hypothetical protein